MGTSKNKAVEVRSVTDKMVGYFIACPGCQADDGTSGHVFSINMADGSPGWSFNGDLENPTFSPSMLARSNIKGQERVCHSFVTNGKIQYLSDCTHSLRGQTVELPTIDRE
jgi:hypothetical protein